jgi:hypothetical protein
VAHGIRGARYACTPYLPHPEHGATYEPTDLVVAYMALEEEISESPARLLIMRYAEAARDMGMDILDPAVIRRVIDGAYAAYGREVEYEARRADFRALAGVRRNEVKHPWVVYYMRMANLVKIGITSGIRRRFNGLHPEEILAVEPGADAVESARHEQFKHLRSHGEWFRLEPELEEHIAALRERFEKETGRSVDAWLRRVGMPEPTARRAAC